MKPLSAAFISLIFSFPAHADEAGYQRMRAARNAMLEVALNPTEFVGRKFEGVCPIETIDTNFMSCMVMNRNGAIVGSAQVALRKLPSAQSVRILNDCVRDDMSDEEIKPDCIIYFRAEIDDYSVIYARSIEKAGNLQ